MSTFISFGNHNFFFSLKRKAIVHPRLCCIRFEMHVLISFERHLFHHEIDTEVRARENNFPLARAHNKIKIYANGYDDRFYWGQTEKSYYIYFFSSFALLSSTVPSICPVHSLTGNCFT